MAKNGGCTYGKVTRNMVENIEDDFKLFRDEMRTEFKELKATNMKLYNHLSNRLPLWAVAAGTLGTALIAATLGAILRGLY